MPFFFSNKKNKDVDDDESAGIEVYTEDGPSASAAATKEPRRNRPWASPDGTTADYPSRSATTSVVVSLPERTVASKASFKSPRCLPRFIAELNPCRSYWFQVNDSPLAARKIDIPESFAPAGCYAFILKLFGAVLTIGTLAYAWFKAAHPDFFLAYLTYWSLVMTSLYFLCSVFNTVNAARTPQPSATATCFIRATWVLFTLAAHSEGMATIMWWVLEFDGQNLTFLNLSPHLIIVLVVWFDGLVVNRIPVRWSHWWGFVLPLDLSYVLWTVIHAFLNVGNPYLTDTQRTDDAIYPSLAWKHDWKDSLIVGAVAVFALGPILFLFLWMCSLYWVPCLCCKEKRKYVDDFKEDQQEDQSQSVIDAEEGSLFSLWK
jgi:hypothetical protein